MPLRAKVVEQTTTTPDGAVTVTKTTTHPDGTVTRTTTTTTRTVHAQPIPTSDMEAQNDSTIPVARATMAAPSAVVIPPTGDFASSGGTGGGISERDENSIRSLSTGVVACQIIGIVCFCVGWLYMWWLWMICLVTQIVALILISVPFCTARTIADTPVKGRLVSSCVVSSVGALFALLAFLINAWLIIGYGISAIIGLVYSIQINNMVGGACCNGGGGP